MPNEVTPAHPLSSNDGIAPSTPDLKSMPASSPFNGIIKNSRYLSDWSDNVIQIDTTVQGATEKSFCTIDLNTFYLPANAPNGPYEHVIALTNFPHWVDTYKIYINAVLGTFKPATANVGSSLMKFVAELRHFTEWCVLNRIYHFKSITRQDIEKLLADWQKGMWYAALDMKGALSRLSEACLSDHKLLARIATRGTGTSGIHFKDSEISRWSGLSMTSKGHIHQELRQAFEKMLGIENAILKGVEDPGQVTEGKLRFACRALNVLARLSSRFDTLTLVPFPDTDQVARLAHVSIGRTENIGIEDSARLLKTALEWVYDFAPAVIGLTKEVGDLLGEHRKKNYSLHHSSDKTLEFLNQRYPYYRDTYKLPLESLGGVNLSWDDRPTLMDLVITVQIACMVLSGINHGRRKNELLGEKELPYGLYFGCISTIETTPPLSRIDVYIEKTVQDWQDFYCNKLVTDAVRVLEDIDRIFNPDPLPADLEGKRQRKLFGNLSSLTIGRFQKERRQSNYKQDCELFFKLAGLDKTVLDHKVHPFRRIFALLYYYRYDHASLFALQQHLRHLHMEMTRIYVTDPDTRAEADKVETLYLRVRKENEEVSEAMAQVGSEYLKDKVREVIEGKPAGGPFAKNVRRIYKIMLQKAEFSEADLSKQAEEIKDRMEAHGTGFQTFPHGGCSAGDSPSKKYGKCYSKEDGLLHREHASPGTCHRCMHHFYNVNYVRNLKTDLELLRAQSEDDDLTLAEQLAARDAADNLEQIIKYELANMAYQSEMMHQASARGGEHKDVEEQ